MTAGAEHWRRVYGEAAIWTYVCATQHPSHNEAELQEAVEIWYDVHCGGELCMSGTAT